MTDLPYGRGGSPLQNLIVQGHETTKLSALDCAEELDAGNIYLKRELSLEGTADQILDRAALLMDDMIAHIVFESEEPTPQVGVPVVFKRRKPKDGNLSSSKNLKSAYDIVRMLDGESYPRSFLETEHLRFEFSEASYDGAFLSAKVNIKKMNMMGSLLPIDDHADDEVLGCGATLAKAARDDRVVHILILAYGETSRTLGGVDRNRANERKRMADEAKEALGAKSTLFLTFQTL